MRWTSFSTIRFAAAFICALCCSPATAQQSAPANSITPPSSIAAAPPSSRLINLDVVVTSQSGQVTPGLQQQDFIVLDDNRPLNVGAFHAAESSPSAADPPAEVVLVLDEANTSYRHMTIARQEVEKFLSQYSGPLPWPISIVFFSDKGTSGTTPSRDAKKVIADLKANPAPLPNANRAQGIYGAVDRYNLSLRTVGQLADFEAKHPGRKLVIWIGPGWLFLANSRIDLSVKDQQNLFHTMVSLSYSLRNARITLYNVDPAGSGSVRRDYYKSFVKPVTAAKQIKGGELALQVLAEQSGGLVLNSTNDLAAEIATCAADANSFYTFSFDGAVGDGPDDYHALAVKVNKPGFNTRTRAGYYAQPGSAAAR